VRVALRERGAPKEWHARLHYVYSDEVADNLARIGAQCREHDVPVAFLINPIFPDESTFDMYGLTRLHEQLRRIAIRNGLVVLDLLGAYEGKDPRSLSFAKDPWHPNLEGHRLIADFLMRRLADQALIPAHTPPS
jgi:lysophospholipase L1-like esterase